MRRFLRQTRDTLIERFNLQRFFRGLGPEQSPVVLNRHRIFILPSREGYMLALILLAMLVGAINYANSLAFLLTFLLAAMAIVTMIHTFRNLAALVFTAGHVPPVFAGQQLAYDITIENTLPPPRPSVELELPGADRCRVDLPADEQRTVSLSRPVRRRGRQPMGRFVISSTFPLGLFRAWAYLDLDMQGTVYPAPAPPGRTPPPAPGHKQSVLRLEEGSEDFRALRDYVPQDSPRHVHWRASARNESLLTKQFSADVGTDLWLDWDQLGMLDCEARLSQLCRWILDAHAEGRAYGLKLPGQTFPLARGEAHMHRCLTALALYQEAAA